MLLKTLRDEQEGRYAGDELVEDLQNLTEATIARSHINYESGSPLCGANKTAKDLLNSKEQLSSRTTAQPKHVSSATTSSGDSSASTPSPAPKRIADRVPLMCRANSVKRAMRNVMEHTKLVDNQQKRSTQHKQPQTTNHSVAFSTNAAAGGHSGNSNHSGSGDHLCVITSSSSETTPWSSPVPPPSINLQSPAVSTTHLTCLSPLPDLRRDSMDEYFFNSLADLPVPKEFADSRRGSANVPHHYHHHQQQQMPTDDGHNPMAYGFPSAVASASKVSAHSLHAPTAAQAASSSSTATASSSSNNTNTSSTFMFQLTSKIQTHNMTTTKTTPCASPNRNRSDSNTVVPVVEAACDPLRHRMCHLDYLVDSSCMSDSDTATHLMPAEAFERQQLHKQQQQHHQEQLKQKQRLLASGAGTGDSQSQQHNLVQSAVPVCPKSANMLQVPSFVVPVLEIQRPPEVTFNDNVYVSDCMTIIDTDLQVKKLLHFLVLDQMKSKRHRMTPNLLNK